MAALAEWGQVLSGWDVETSSFDCVREEMGAVVIVWVWKNILAYGKKVRL